MLKYMDYIYEVYRNKSFSKAARALYISQPSLSAIVKKTEEELGVQLIDRSSNPISLTEAGEIYIQTITRMMEMEKTLRERLSELASGKETSFRIGGASFYCTYVLPPLISDYESLGGKCRVIPFEANTNDLVESLKTGIIDLSINVDEQDPLLFDRKIWKKEHIILAVPSRFDINRSLRDLQLPWESILDGSFLTEHYPAAPLEAFSDQPFLFLKKRNDIFHRGMQMCENAGFRPRIVMHLDQLLTSFYIAADGRGVCFVRDDLLRYIEKDDRLMFYKISDPLQERNVYIYYRKKENLRPAVRDFLDFLTSEE